MKKQTNPTTVRLTPKATAVLVNLEAQHPGTSRSILVENAMIESAAMPDKLPITDEEFKHAARIYKYLVDVATAHFTGPRQNEPKAIQIGLAAKSAALLLKRIIMDAKGRIVISKP